MLGYEISTEVIGGLLTVALLFVGSLALKKWLPDWTNAVAYAIGISATGLLMYVLFLGIIEMRDTEREPQTIEKLVSTWLQGPDVKSVMPLGKPPSGELFHTNFIYGKHTVNLVVRKNRPDFLLVSIPEQLSHDQQTWWSGLHESERNDVLYDLQREVGLDTDIAFGVTQVELGSGNDKSFMFYVEKHIPIDMGLTKPWFWRDIESCARFTRVYRIAFDRYYKKYLDRSR